MNALTQTSPLALRCRLEKRETPTSLAARLARRNRCSNVGEFCADIGTDWNAIVRGDGEEILRLARASGVDEGDLRHWAFRPKGRTRLEIGHEIGTYTTVSRSRLRLCVECVVAAVAERGFEGAFRRADWQFLSIRTCDRHHHRLRDVPDSRSTLVRGCNYDIVKYLELHWEEILALRARSIEQRETSLEQYIRRRLDGRRGSRWIDELALPIVSRASEMLGARIVHGPAIAPAKLTDDMLHAAGSVGFDVISDGPSALRKCLTDLSREAARQGILHQRGYGLFMDWLAETRGLAEIAPLKDVVRDHIIESSPLRPGERVLGVKIGKPRRISFTSAARQIGIRPQQLIELRASGRIGRTDRDSEAYGLSTDEFRQLKARVGDRIGFREAAEIIGCAPDHVERFLNAAMLTRKTPGATWLSPGRQDVKALVAPVMKLPCRAADDQFLPLDEISSRLKWPVHQLYGAFLAGQISGAFRLRDEHGLRALLLCEEHVRRDLKVEASGIVSFRGATRMLNASFPTLRVLADSGRLRSAWTEDPRIGLHLEKSSLTAFQEQFVTLGEMAARMEAVRRPIQRRLDRLGIPVEFEVQQTSRIYRRDLCPPEVMGQTAAVV